MQIFCIIHSYIASRLSASIPANMSALSEFLVRVTLSHKYFSVTCITSTFQAAARSFGARARPTGGERKSKRSKRQVTPDDDEASESDTESSEEEEDRAGATQDVSKALERMLRAEVKAAARLLAKKND
jgi:hypothetical protein